jgi:O-antigen biosynthesis protein
MEVDASGADHPLAVTQTTLWPGNAQRAVKTQGTNCAFRADILRRIGGFDPAYHFYLDEADVNLRMAALGGLTAIVPDAQVHHGYAASTRRRHDRVPTTLFDIGSSSAVFLRKHGNDAAVWPRLQAEQRQRALRHMVAGRIMPGDVARLMQTLQDGWDHGQTCALQPLLPLSAGTSFLPLGTGPRPGRILAGRPWQMARLQQTAGLMAQTHIVSIFCLSPTAWAHQMQFDARGFWVQRGGVLGRSERTAPRVQWMAFANRITAETRRIMAYRRIID